MRDSPEMLASLEAALAKLGKPEAWYEDENGRQWFKRQPSFGVDKDGLSQGVAKEMASKYGVTFHEDPLYYVFIAV